MADDPIGIFRSIFGDGCFNSGRIENSHICFCRISSLSDGVCNVNKLTKYKLQIIKKSCLKQVILEAFGTLIKLQNSWRGFE